jgi:DnaJ-class molecular chaperone
VIVSIDFEQFPELVCHHIIGGAQHKIVIEMVPKRHPIYYWDPLLDGWDLYTTMPISLHEYMMGCTKTIPRLGQVSTLPNEPLLLQVPAFPGLKSPMVYEGAGLRGKGNLYVMLEVVLPTKDNWEMLKKESLCSTNEFLCVCKKLENLNAPHRTPS